MATRKREGLLIAGGGLAGSLAALAMAKYRPEIPILLVEEGPSFGGNHIWSFFDEDIAGDEELVAPLIAARWPAYDVAFPKRRRTLEAGYASVSSERLDAAVRAALRPDQYRLNTRIVAVQADALVLGDGSHIVADGAIDARGAAHLNLLDLGWQKFVGRDYVFDAPHGVERPIIMDATVDQADGYRFVYCLPFDAHRMLVEDTYYSNDSALDAKAIGARIDAYVAGRGWSGGTVAREEKGVLPVAMGGDFEAFWRHGGARVAKLGLRGGLFHPTTGYSFPDAVRAAMLLTRQSDFSGAALHAVFENHAASLWKRRKFYRNLNRMLFRAAEPSERYRVFELFYRLRPALIGRFYAGTSGLFDTARILAGRPPVPIVKAARALRGLKR